ncbi:MAG: HAD family hydrolase [bacterium]|nr:HAD family hydrolase [bacterium]
MPDSASTKPSSCKEQGFLLWDMAGTLIPFDSVSGRASILPGSEEFLPELGKDFRMVVTTGDETQSARNLLSGFGLLQNFEEVFGGLYTPLGKPYGAVLKKMGGHALCSLAIGDRLRADLPSDTSDVVLVLVNQAGEHINAGMISFLIKILNKSGDDFVQAFHQLSDSAEERPELIGDFQGGRIVSAWYCKKGMGFNMLVFEHILIEGPRLIISF